MIHKYLAKKKSLNQMIGPVKGVTSIPQLHFNCFEIIPKGHSTGKWWLITGLSFPEGKSMNDGIKSALCLLSYISVDDVDKIVAAFGKGGPLGKDGH